MQKNHFSSDQLTIPLMFEWHITISEKTTAIAALTVHAERQNIELTTAKIKQAIAKGALWITSEKNKKQTTRLRRVKKELKQGEQLHFYYNQTVLDTPVPEAQLIKDYQDYSVWYKPFGMLSQGSKWSDHCTIARYAQQHLPNERSAFIVHRLDKAATGLILIAHNKRAAQALSALFENRQLEKTYHIVVHGNHLKQPQPTIIEQDIDGKKSRSRFNCLAYNESTDRSLIQVQIDSGRKHQIRRHAASINMPVVGDRLHGIADESEPLNLQLCAVSLRFICPINDTEQYIELPDKLKPQLP